LYYNDSVNIGIMIKIKINKLISDLLYSTKAMIKIMLIILGQMKQRILLFCNVIDVGAV